MRMTRIGRSTWVLEGAEIMQKERKEKVKQEYLRRGQLMVR